MKLQVDKIKAIFKIVGSMIFSFFIPGFIFLWIFSKFGMEEFTAALFASQLSVLILALFLIGFDFKYLLSRIKDKINVEAVFITIGVVMLMFISNAMFSVFLAGQGFTSDTTASAVNSGNVLASFILPVVLAPIAEELAFRVGFKRTLVDKGGFKPLSYVILSSIIFGALHWQQGEFGLLIVAMTGTVGIIKSFVYLKTDNVLITIAGHMIYNGIIMSIAMTVL